MEHRTVEGKVDFALDYLLHLPRGYDDEDAWPLVLFLHGSGERGRDLWQVTQHGLPKMALRNGGLPYVMVAPQCPPDTWWTWHTHSLMALLDDVIASHHVDHRRVCLTGISMGGIGTWELGAQFPDRFAALAPICGRGTPWLASRLSDVPIWAFHNDGDPSVPVEHSEQMVHAVNTAGGTAKLTIYEGSGHDAWTRAYAEPEFHDWLLTQQSRRS